MDLPIDDKELEISLDLNTYLMGKNFTKVEVSKEVRDRTCKNTS